jgi:CheY-like chemotaxis protein
MSRSVLLVEPDVDALGALASELRSRGLTVALADAADGALDRARNNRPDAVLLSSALDDVDAVIGRFKADRELAEVPHFVLVEPAGADALPSHQLPRGDADLIARRMYALPLHSAPVAADRGDFRGDLRQVSPVDLLQLLSMNRRSGALSITTPSGAGEVRLVEGEVVDAVYRRLEAEKALFRLLGETEGAFAFAGGSGTPLRRIQTSTSMLLMEGMRRIDEVKQRRSRLAADEDALLAIAAAPEEAPELDRRVSEVLGVPCTVDELLDDVPFGDLEIIEAVGRMIEAGVVRRIAKGAERVELADPEQMTVLGALAKRLQHEGFAGAARVLVAAAPRRLSTVMHSVRRIHDAVAPAESVPAAPVPYLMATLRLAEGEELEIVGLPTIDAYSPVWPLTLAGSAIAVRLESAEASALEAACSVAGVPVIDAGVLLGDIDEADPAQMAALIRMALDSVSAR